jgi:hypothetical protein
MKLTAELAFQIFLKKMPNERFNDMTLRAYTSTAEDSIKIAKVFLDSLPDTNTHITPNFSDESDL